MSVDPVFDAAPDLSYEGGPLSAWFTDPPGAVVQLTEAVVFSKDMAEWIVGPGFEELSKRFPRCTELNLVLDLRPMTSREPAARPVIMAAGMKHMFMFTKVAVIAPQKPQPLYMSTLHGAVALLSAIGPEVRIFETIEEAQQMMALRPIERQKRAAGA